MCREGGSAVEKIRFTKMHGIGNDYVYIDCMNGVEPDGGALAVAMSPRRFSVGSDGVIMICRSRVADAKMRMFNADGSEGKMCGNGIRCVGKFLYDRGYAKKETVTVETLSGIKTLDLCVKDGKAVSVAVDMGRAITDPRLVPAKFEGDAAIEVPAGVPGFDYLLTAVSMGNPHAVIFTENVDSLDLEKIGPSFENNPAFPDRVNTEFAEFLAPDVIKMRVWERGSGETFACGTGACATAVAAVLTKRAAAGVPLTLRLRGGDLSITVREDLGVTMEGPAVTVYDGEFYL